MKDSKISPDSSHPVDLAKSKPPDDEAQTSGESFYQVKWINFQGVLYAVVTQNENGPCPLLAIINVLLLRGQVSLQKDVTCVSEQYLLELVGDCILKLKPKVTTENLEEPVQRNYEQIIDDVLQLVQTLPKGLDVNPHFTGAKVFEYTPSCALFDALNIRLLHGWVVDPEQKQLVELLNGLGYNQVAEKAINTGCDSNAFLFQHFLESTASQLTNYGLSQLCNELKDGEIAILFRNNHFHTLYKNQVDLYVLVTDQGYLNEPFVVWETLNCIDGNSSFVDAQFLDSNLSKQNPTQSEESKKADYLLALSLQEEERTKEQLALKHEDRKQSCVGDVPKNLISSGVPGCEVDIAIEEEHMKRHDREYRRKVIANKEPLGDYLVKSIFLGDVKRLNNNMIWLAPGSYEIAGYLVGFAGAAGSGGFRKSDWDCHKPIVHYF